MRLLSAILVAILLGLGVSLWRSYGTLHPCGILQQDLADYRARGQHGWLPAAEIERMVADMQTRYGALACVVGLGFLHAETIAALLDRISGKAARASSERLDSLLRSNRSDDALTS